MKLLADLYNQNVKGSSVFSRPVLQQSLAAAIVSMLIYLFCQRPDAKLNDVGENGEMYFRCVPLLRSLSSPPSAWIAPRSEPSNLDLCCLRVIGMCLSFLSVFISNMCYGRFWEARGHVGRVCNDSRSFARKLLYSTELHAGIGEEDRGTIDTLIRYEKAFFVLLVQDVRVQNNLDAVPDEILTPPEKEQLGNVRRRSLMILGWMALLVRDLARNHKVSPRMENSLTTHLDEMSEAFHGCSKIKSQPLPFSYAQLIAMITLVFCLSVPVTFISSFGWFLAIPTFVRPAYAQRLPMRPVEAIRATLSLIVGVCPPCPRAVHGYGLLWAEHARERPAGSLWHRRVRHQPGGV